MCHSFQLGQGKIRPTQSHILEGYLIRVLVVLNLNSPRVFLNTYVCRSENQSSLTSSIFVDVLEIIDIKCLNSIPSRKDLKICHAGCFSFVVVCVFLTD
jgi:hypothetical protein